MLLQTACVEEANVCCRDREQVENKPKSIYCNLKEEEREGDVMDIKMWGGSQYNSRKGIQGTLNIEFNALSSLTIPSWKLWGQFSAMKYITEQYFLADPWL